LYRPPAFKEDRVDVMHDAIRNNPLGTLVTSGHEGLQGDHIPFLIRPEAGGYGTLLCHLAKANRHLDTLRACNEAMVMFQGPHAYISPSLYASKKVDGKVVPTWNYIAVHAWGEPTVIDDPRWLMEQVTALTDRQEAGREDRWHVSDAPSDFMGAQLKGIVGVQVIVKRMEGKWKVSQNRPAADRATVAAGLVSGNPAEAEMARQVAERNR
jgi:transcriptional regulator